MPLLMSLLRTLLVFASFLVSLLVVAISGIWILAIAFGSYSVGLLALFPWFFGVCGVVGLFRSRSDRAARSPWELRTDVVLLVLGIMGALIFAALYIARFGADSRDVASSHLMLLAAIFPLLPVGVATFEINRSVALWRTTPLPVPERLRRFLTMLIIAPLVIGSVRILAQEAAMMWYGRDLVAAAHASAEHLSKGGPYCVMDFDGARSFEDLDKRRILVDAFKNRIDYLMGRTTLSASPHFGIEVDGKDYWWSFRERKFLWYRPGSWLRVPPTTCQGPQAHYRIGK
jgi:hypothetical protein